MGRSSGRSKFSIARGPEFRNHLQIPTDHAMDRSHPLSGPRPPRARSAAAAQATAAAAAAHGGSAAPVGQHVLPTSATTNSNTCAAQSATSTTRPLLRPPELPLSSAAKTSTDFAPDGARAAAAQAQAGAAARIRAGALGRSARGRCGSHRSTKRIVLLQVPARNLRQCVRCVPARKAWLQPA